MYLIVVLIAIVVLQFWGAQNPLHRDEMFARWRTAIAKLPALPRHPWLQLLVAVMLPVGTVVVAALLLPTFLWFILAVVILLYSLGRGEFATDVQGYALACSDNAWHVAATKARQQGVDTDPLAIGDWSTLHQKMLEATAYQGFERLFAVLFWFLLFGPAGALLYRLSFLYQRQVIPDQSTQSLQPASRWLWALEWPAVRILGLSFAITGNFVGCVNRWKSYVLSAEYTSAHVLRETVLGALSVDDELVQSCDCTQREVTALKRLYARTLWFWVGCLAVVTLLY